MDKKFVLGTGRRTITPPLGTPLYGYSQKREATAVNDDLHVPLRHSVTKRLRLS